MYLLGFFLVLSLLFIGVLLYFMQFRRLLDTTRGLDIDTMYFRYGILVFLLLSIGVFLITAPLIGFLSDTPFMQIVEVMLSSSVFLLISVRYIHALELEVEAIKTCRGEKERFQYQNQTTVRRLAIWIPLLGLIGVGGGVLLINGAFPFWYEVVTVLYLVLLWWGYTYIQEILKHVKKDEQNMRNHFQEKG